MKKIPSWVWGLAGAFLALASLLGVELIVLTPSGGGGEETAAPATEEGAAVEAAPAAPPAPPLDCSGAQLTTLDDVSYVVIPLHEGDSALWVEGWTIVNGSCRDGHGVTVTVEDLAKWRGWFQSQWGEDLPLPFGLSSPKRTNSGRGVRVRCFQGFVEDGCFK